ncbi:hypothetical protein EDD29_6029 [Actinocorallia herbida]|uniref:Uncharacterized protein n=1 Tax=Actinocorallia herbida TaxID=58109 RepID=A0A3N1D4A0_9ACTN|nr:hypothetical protein [Actinocorallia herbida]ROO88361.1 hypothetical protein EDD29_6029 [Actinocorallia herbida]
MNWQTSGGVPADDPFAKAEADVRAMTSSAWWQTAAPQQRAEQVISRLLAGPGEWWLYGAWGRWYRCGLDGHWHPSPPPADAAARRVLAPAPPGVGNPPVPPQLIPTGPDIGAGLMAGAGLLADGPSAELVARVQQTLVTAIAVDPQQFAMQDPAFQPGTPTTVAALWGAVLFSAGTPVVLAEHPLVAMFAPYLTVQAEHLRWMIAPDLTRLAVYYTDRLGAHDPVGAAFVVRMMGELAGALAADRAFQPGASALAAICATTLQYVQADQQAMAYGPQTVAKEWLRRCPAEFAAPIVREASPGEYLRLALYDLALLYGDLTEGTARPPAELRRAAAAVFAADLQTIPQAVPAVLPWLDPESARTVQEVLGQAQHPLRELFPQGVRLPPGLSSTDPGKVRALLALTHTLAMTACRLAQTAPQHLEFIVPAACAAELGTPALSRPKATGELTAWEIINAARRHLADERGVAHPSAPPASPAPGPQAAVPAPAVPPVAPPPSPEPSSFDDDPFATRPNASPAAPSPADGPRPDPFGRDVAESSEVPPPFDPNARPAGNDAPPAYDAYGQPSSSPSSPPPGPNGSAAPPYAPSTSPAHGSASAESPAVPRYDPSASPAYGQGPSGGSGIPPYDPSASPVHGQGSAVPRYDPSASPVQGQGSGVPPYDPSASPVHGQGSPGGSGAPAYDPSASPVHGQGPAVPPYDPSASPVQGQGSPGGSGIPRYDPSASPVHGHGSSEGSAVPPFDPQARPVSGASAPPAYDAYGQPVGNVPGQAGPVEAPYAPDPYRPVPEGESPPAYDAYGQPLAHAAPAPAETSPYAPDFTGPAQVADGTAPYLPTFAAQSPPPPPAPAQTPVPAEPFGLPGAPSGGTTVQAYGIRFLCGADDVERMLTEVRRRGKWAQQLRGQEVSSASAPAVLLVGAPSTGQRRLARMITRALAEVGFSGERLRTLHLEQVRENGPDGLPALLDAHSGETLLLEGLDELILDDGQGDAYARALYRVRAEGVTTTTLVASVRPERFEEFAAAHPEIVTDFRTVRLPDLEGGEARLNLLALLAAERFVTIDDHAWQVVRAEFGPVAGRGRLVNARLVETFLDRACTRHLGTADDTLAVIGDHGFVLGAQDVAGIAADLPR